jgi:hypothetical protein
MANRLDNVVITALLDHGRLDDDQLGAQTGTSRQSARSVAIRLSKSGIVVRRKEVGAKWTTEISHGASPRMPTMAAAASVVPVSPIDIGAVSAALDSLQAFLGENPPRVRVGQLELLVVGAGSREARAILQREHIDDDVLRAALLVKRAAGEINVVIHALGIMLSLPHLLELDERVVSTSLGAGAGGRQYDLETTHRIAEFKFTQWRGNDSLRQRELFADFVNLAESEDTRRRQLFVTGAALPLRFLWSSKLALTTVCARRPEILTRIQIAHSDTFRTVADYTAAHRDSIEIVDLHTILPAYIVREIEAVGRNEVDRR